MVDAVDVLAVSESCPRDVFADTRRGDISSVCQFEGCGDSLYQPATHAPLTDWKKCATVEACSRRGLAGERHLAASFAYTRRNDTATRY